MSIRTAYRPLAATTAGLLPSMRVDVCRTNSCLLRASISELVFGFANGKLSWLFQKLLLHCLEKQPGPLVGQYTTNDGNAAPDAEADCSAGFLSLLRPFVHRDEAAAARLCLELFRPFLVW